MTLNRLVVIGASSGGVRALEDVVAGLPPDFAAPVLIVLHVSAHHENLLPQILAGAGPLRAAQAVDGERLQPGHVYVAPPDRHLMVTADRIRVTSGPKENHFRPSVDVLFRSAAYYHGPRVIGMILSGLLSDGSSGLYATKRAGGVAIVQDPNEAAYKSMPLAALERGYIDHTLAAADMGPLLVALLREPPPEEPLEAAQYRQGLKFEIDIAAAEPAFEKDVMGKLEPSSYTCPSCNGVLHRVKEGAVDRFRCHTGHGFTMASLVERYGESLEDSLWEAAKGLQESIALVVEAADGLRAAGQTAASDALAAQSRELMVRLETIRKATLSDGAPL